MLLNRFGKLCGKHTAVEIILHHRLIEDGWRVPLIAAEKLRRDAAGIRLGRAACLLDDERDFWCRTGHENHIRGFIGDAGQLRREVGITSGVILTCDHLTAQCREIGSEKLG